MEQPLVSIVIPVYNGERYLAETLDSIFAQDYRPFEVIVVDDGSTDGSAHIVQSYQKIRYVHQENQGVPVARNAGIKAARGDFIAFSDQDDVWKPHKLQAQMEYLLQHPDVDYVISRKRLFLEPGVERPRWLKEELLDADHVAFTPSALVARTSVFKKIGFNPDFQTASDVDWFFRAKDANIPMAIIPDVLLLKRIHAQNQSNQVQALHAEYLKLIKASIQQQRKRSRAERG